VENTEKELISQSIEGDREAFRALVEKYQGKVLRLVTQIVRSQEDAEDIVQDTLVKAFLSLGTFKGQSSFYTWLYRIAFNKAIDFKRMVARRGGSNTSELSDIDTGKVTALGGATEVENPVQTLIRREQAEAIDKALNSLSPEHRSVMILREVDGLSYEEIAKITNVSLGTVMSRLHYARKKLQTCLQSGNDPDGIGVKVGSTVADHKIDHSMLISTRVS
jgi:RNA polymerase sigma-70 factor (ECF subfamily)